MPEELGAVAGLRQSAYAPILPIVAYDDNRRPFAMTFHMPAIHAEAEREQIDRSNCSNCATLDDMDMEMLTIDPARMTRHDFDRNADPEWAALADYLRAAAAAGAVVRLSARPETLTPAEAAARLGMSRSTITRRIRSGEIKSVKVGTHHRIPIREFERFRDTMMGAMIADASADIEADLYGQ